MKAEATWHGQRLTVYVINLCYYGEEGDFEVFPNRPLDLKLPDVALLLAERGYALEQVDAQVVIFHADDAEYTLYDEGRLIVEHLKPGTPENALAVAAAILEYEILR